MNYCGRRWFPYRFELGLAGIVCNPSLWSGYENKLSRLRANSPNCKSNLRLACIISFTAFKWEQGRLCIGIENVFRASLNFMR